jgi:hypothetical protein
MYYALADEINRRLYCIKTSPQSVLPTTWLVLRVLFDLTFKKIPQILT